MQIGGDSKTVTLNVDLTKYDNRCVIGSKGKTIPNKAFGMIGNFDHFVAIKFDSGATLDVAYNSISIKN